jgi:hypothetical protein
MELSIKKLNYYKLLRLFLNVGFLVLLAYECLFVYRLYKVLNNPLPQPDIKHLIRLDFKSLNQAAIRYQAGQNYDVPAVGPGNPVISDPFANNVPIPATH